MDLRLPAAVLLFAAGGALTTSADLARESPKPPAGAASLLGGFSAVAAQAVWIEADRAILAREEDRAVVLLRALVELEPQIPSAARYAAQEIGWNMLQGRGDPAVRWSLVREALAILDGCVAANPGSAEALRNRGRFLFQRVAADPTLAESFSREIDPRGALATAGEDLERSFDLDPTDAETAGGLAYVAGRLGVGFLKAGRWADAASALRACVRAYDRTLADAREQLGRSLDVPGPEHDGFVAMQSARDQAAALLEAANAGDAARPALFDRFRRRFPDLGL